MSSPARDSRGRVRLLGLTGVFVFAVLSVRLFYIQVIEYKEHAESARNQQIERIRTPPSRGRILDRNGTPLAYTIDNPIVIAEPRLLTDLAVRRRVAQALSPLLQVTVAELEKKMSVARPPTVILNEKPTPVSVAELKAQNLPGIRIETQPKRVYPLGAAAAHVTGFVGKNQEGIEGTELAFESDLQGTPGWATLRRDAHGGRHATDYKKAAVAGNDLTLTIDSYLQEVTSSRLNDAVKKCNAKAGWAIVMDPQTGDILAMANSPDYDPTFYDRSPAANLRNHILSDRIEPGSTIKALTVAAALEEGVMRPETLVNCMNGKWMLQGRAITDHEKFGTLTFMDTFVHSSNVAMAQVGLKLGPDRLYHYLKKFGFGAKTGLGLPGEDPGYLKSTKYWSGRTPATIAFGYEVQVTALQLALAYAALANDGILMKPRFVKSVKAPDGSLLVDNGPEQVRRVVTERTASRLLEFMGKVVTDGTGKMAALDWCVVGGKTGTARKLDPKTKQYVNRHYASFVGVAPLDRPRLLCYIVIDEPRGNIYGGSTAAPAFREIIEAAGKAPRPIVRPDFDVVTAGPTPEPGVASKLVARMLAPFLTSVTEAAAETAAVHQDLAAAEADTGEAAASLRAAHEASGSPAPDYIGLTMRQAMRQATLDRLQLNMTGSGVVVRQFPAPGEILPDGSRLTLFLGDRKELEQPEDNEDP